MNGEHLDRFWHGVCTTAPLGAWVPWAEVVQIVSGHGFTLETRFHFAEHWLTLGALEMGPMWRPGKVMDPTEVVRIRFLYHRDIHGEQGLVCVSSEEEDLDHGKGEVQLEHAAAASAISPRRWKTDVLDPVEGVEVTLPLPQPLTLPQPLRVQWTEYVGLKRRGDAESLYLEQRDLNKSKSQRKSNGGASLLHTRKKSGWLWQKRRFVPGHCRTVMAPKPISKIWTVSSVTTSAVPGVVMVRILLLLAQCKGHWQAHNLWVVGGVTQEKLCCFQCR